LVVKENPDWNGDKEPGRGDPCLICSPCQYKNRPGVAGFALGSPNVSPIKILGKQPTKASGSMLSTQFQAMKFSVSRVRQVSIQQKVL
jgi:hypothetical protein